MALFSFGKKKEKAPEVAAPVGKTPSTAPKIQTPPLTANFPAIKPPQPTGLMPAIPIPAGAAMTQPMAVPRTSSTGLKPSKTGAAGSTRSTQRIVLPTPPGGRSNTRALSMADAVGKINLPIGMVLRCMPPETLSGDVSDFEKTGAAGTEIGLPMNMILGQLPSGKVEMTVQDLIPHIPPGYLQPAEALTSFLPVVVSLPLMDVVMRIPPDLLALRPDQKDVDAAVINMADPFTEEVLREQAEAARRQAGANIIEESQAPQEEFVPSQGTPTKSVAPPRRPMVEPLAASRTAATTLAAPVVPAAKPTPPGLAPQRSFSGPPLPPAATSPALPPPGARTPTGQIPTPVRMSAPLPQRQAAKPPAVAGAPVPPVPRHTGPIPAPPPPRHTASLPTVPRRTGTLASLSQSLTGAAKAAAVATTVAAVAEAIEKKETAAPVEEKPASEASASPLSVTPGEPDAGKDDLQRLAALAMAQLGETSEELPTHTAPVTTFAPPAEPQDSLIITPATAFAPRPPEVEAAALAETAPAAEVKAEPGPERESFITSPPPMRSEPESAPEPPATLEEPIRAPEPEPVAAAPVEEPVHAPEPEPVALMPVEEPIRAPEPVATGGLDEPIRAPAPEPVAAMPVSEPIRPEPGAARAEEPIRAPAPEPMSPAHSEEPVHATEAQPAHEVDASSASVAFNLNTCTADDLVHHITGCSAALAAAIIAYREKIGSFAHIEQLLGVPGMTREAYTNLTGEPPPESRPHLSVNDLLGFPPQQHVTLKDVTDRIACWPDVTGCLLSQSSGLSLVGSAPPGFEKEAVVAFAPRMFETLNKSYSEITGEETDVLIIPTAGTSFHLFRSHDLYLIIMSRVPLMPERHVKVARFVVSALSERED